MHVTEFIIGRFFGRSIADKDYAVTAVAIAAIVFFIIVKSRGIKIPVFIFFREDRQ